MREDGRAHQPLGYILLPRWGIRMRNRTDGTDGTNGTEGGWESRKRNSLERNDCRHVVLPGCAEAKYLSFADKVRPHPLSLSARRGNKPTNAGTQGRCAKTEERINRWAIFCYPVGVLECGMGRD